MLRLEEVLVISNKTMRTIQNNNMNHKINTACNKTTQKKMDIHNKYRLQHKIRMPRENQL